MSRLCRLRTKTHGEDGQWAYDEIVSQRQQIEALTAQVGVLEEQLANFVRPDAFSSQGNFPSGFLTSAGGGDDSTGTPDMYHQRNTCLVCLQQDNAALVDLNTQLTAQVGVLREALITCRSYLGDPANFDCYGTEKELVEFLRQVKLDEDSAIDKADKALSTTPESALSEVRLAERERVAQFVDDNCTYGDTHILVKAILAMGDE